ncbi:hypothetical protein OAU13_00040 [bacterium]|nr:hypothetical protein [bacterium]
MTTPQIPANSIELSDVRDEINPGTGSGIQSLGSNVVVRKLTGTFEKNRTQTSEILLGADLSNKTAFSEILTPSNSNTQSGIAPVTASMTVTANTDMFEPVINWSYVINPDSINVTADDISITRNVVFDPVTNRPASKSANVVLRSSRGNKFANLTITGVMQFPNYDAQGLQEIGTHIVNTCTKNISLTVNAVNTAFQVTATPSFTVDATGVLAQTAVITVKASANDQISGTSFKFTPTFVSGTGRLNPITTADTITFTAGAPQPGTSSAIYSLLTEFYINNVLIESNTSTVDIRAQFIDRQITSLTTTATTNNQFSNSSSQYATIDVTALHNAVAPTYTQGTITLTYEVNGDAITTQELSSNSSAKTERISLYYEAANGFGFKKSTIAVVATLRTPDGAIMDQKRVANLVLRAGTYGLNVVPPTSVTQSGYAAQTAVTSGSAAWGASQAAFTWTPRQFNGSGPDLKITTGDRSSSFTITATTPTGKNKSQTISNTCNYDFTGVLTYDGITIRTVSLSDILIKAESLPYTYSVSPAATSNTQMEIDSGTTASVTVTGSASVGTITWSKSDSSGTVGIATTSTTANVFVTSSGSGSSNVGSTVVVGELRDGSSRLIESIQTQTISLDATTTKLRIVGENVSKNTDEKTSTATGIFESTALFGTHSLRYPPVKQSGSNLDLFQDSSQRIRILATATQSSKSGTYRITGEVTYKGISRTTTKDVTVAVSALAPTLTATKVNYDYSYYIPFGGINFSGLGGQVTGIGGSATYVIIKGQDIIVESDYPGTINVDYTIDRVVNVIDARYVTLTGPFYNQTANTDPAPAGYPASINKRRDRVELVPFLGLILNYDITYVLKDAAGNFLIDLRVTSDDITVGKPGAVTSLKFDNVTAKTYSFTNKSNNGFGYPEPYPLQVDYQERADYTASYVAELAIPTPRFTFSTVKSNPAASVSLTSNPVNGQANILVKSIYYDTSSNFSGTLPTVTTSTGTVELSTQLTSTSDSGTIVAISEPAAQSRNFELPMPPGRCYRLSTFSTYGVRMKHTLDVFGNSSEIIDYGRVPNISSLNGPETKYVGFHTGSLRYPLDSGPIYGSDASQTRYYSSTAHRTTFTSQYSSEAYKPNKIIPENYFVVMSFDPSGPQYIAQVTLIGSDNKAYNLPLWASGRGGTRASNDNFSFNIYAWDPPSGVTVSYAFISNVGQSAPPPPFGGDELSFIKAEPGNYILGEKVYANIGTVSGGILEEEYTGPIDEDLR